MTPSFVGPYAIEGELGRGGMGVVYAGRHLELGRRAAVKVLLDDCSSPDAKERFQRECEALARLNHPGVVRVYDSGFQGDNPFVALELVEGPDLKQLLVRDGPWEPEATVRLGIELCAAVAHAHAAGILHRDLKPANVLIDPEGRARITDFGLAKEVKAESITETGAMLGTAAYMPPEQAAGEKALIGPASDVYGLGATLFHVLTGRTPFEGPLATLLTHIFTKSVPPPSSFRPGLDPALDALILRCLEKKPEDRYASADELAEALRLYLLGEAPAGAPSSGHAKVGLVALAVIAVLACLGLLALALTPGPAPPPTAEARARAAWRKAKSEVQVRAWLLEHGPHAEPSGLGLAEERLAELTWKELKAAQGKALGGGPLPGLDTFERLKGHRAVQAWARQHLAKAGPRVAKKARAELDSLRAGRVLAVLGTKIIGKGDGAVSAVFRPDGRLLIWDLDKVGALYDLEAGSAEKVSLEFDRLSALAAHSKRVRVPRGETWAGGKQFLELTHSGQEHRALSLSAHLTIKDFLVLDDSVLLIGHLNEEEKAERGFLSLVGRSKLTPVFPSDDVFHERTRPTTSVPEVAIPARGEHLTPHPSLTLWYASGGDEEGTGFVSWIERAGDSVSIKGRLELPAAVRCAAISADATLLVVGLARGGARVYPLTAEGGVDASRYTTLAPRRAGLAASADERDRTKVSGLCFLPGGGLLVCSRRHKERSRFDLSAWEPSSLRGFKEPQAHKASEAQSAQWQWVATFPGQGRGLSLSPDGSLIALGTLEQRALLLATPPRETALR